MPPFTAPVHLPDEDLRRHAHGRLAARTAPLPSRTGGPVQQRCCRRPGPASAPACTDRIPAPSPTRLPHNPTEDNDSNSGRPQWSST